MYLFTIRCLRWRLECRIRCVESTPSWTPTRFPRLAFDSKLRIAGGLTQAEVAKAIGVQRVAVARWEAGLTQPHRNNRLKYAELLRQLAEEHPAAVQEVSDED